MALTFVRFALLAPLAEGSGAGYALFAQLGEEAALDFQEVARLLEAELQLNFHYRHARGLSQLEPIKVFLIAESEDAVVIYRRHFVAKGVKPGELKINALAVDGSWADWPGSDKPLPEQGLDAECQQLSPIVEVHPRGFEPLTFGSVV